MARKAHMNRREMLTFGCTALLALAPSRASAQAKYPDRPIRLIIPFAPGGVVDVIGRLWADKLSPLLGTVVVENQGGAGGVLAASDVARAQPDGYTLLLGTTSTQIINPTIMSRPLYDPAKDFVAVSIIAISATAVVVHPSVPAKTLQEFVAYAKANADKLSYGSAGAGTVTNLSGELFKQLIGAREITHVPYKGAGPAISDLVSGHIPMMTPNITGQVLDLHHAGKLRILAVAAPARLRAAPDIPAAVETLPGMVAQQFNGLFAPAGTSKEIVERVAQATGKAMGAAEFQKTLVEAGFEPVLDSAPEQAQRFVEEERVRLAPAIRASGMRAE